MSAKRFLLLGCLAAFLAAAFFPSGSALGQGIAETSKLYTVYQHDHHGYNYPLYVFGEGTTVSFANVFRAIHPYDETLLAVSFHTLLKDTRYEVSVILNYSGTTSLDGGKVVSQGTLKEPGYHAIDLALPITISRGSRFAIVVRQTAFSRPAVATDSARAESAEDSVSLPGESYVLLRGSWVDLYTTHPNTNVCVKAYTRSLTPEPPKMSVEDMEKELEYVLGRMSKDHPVVGKRGFTVEQLDIIASVRQKTATPLSKQDFNFEMLRIFSMLGEGQTLLQEAFLPEKQYLDLSFQWLMGDGMVVNEDSGNLRKGDQILSIGGKSPEELIQMLWKVIPAENEYWVRYSAQTALRWGSYLTYLGLVNAEGTVDVEIQRDGKTSTHHIPLTGVHSWPPPMEPVEWRIEQENDLGYLCLNDLPPREDIGSLEAAIGLFFNAVKTQGVSNIVIDLRHTNGRYSAVNGVLLSYLDTGPVYASRNQLFRGEKKPDTELFRGNTYVLTSNRSSGATVLLARLLHDNGIATTLGEPTGEGPSFNYSNVSWEELPVTGWRFRLATEEGSERPGNHDSSAVTLFPDIPVYTSRQDLISGRDAQMAKVRDLIARKLR